MSMNATPLSAYDGGDPTPASVSAELRMAAEILDETATADIHSDADMIRSAVALRMRLRALVAALDAKAGEGQ
ncbi:hypothetical protein [Streptomyces sp. S1D4-20]|uniref:hypothetical protein n=1 Tax=Streptomyces sp. S1D4-20 TaxID=2594462 RepID=UPI001163B75A|nr:hypothetical protein [Streptomyces sp. S1D4-20]QDN58691.1 hypothetical protein FNV67_28280 [Streptomyces sp. S1D4-20]